MDNYVIMFVIMTVSTVKLSDLLPDNQNANRHTERGEYMIRKSIEKFGFAEAGTLDANNKIIGGNLRTEASADVLAAEDAIVIDVDGKRPVYIRRRDIDLDTPEGRELAIALNRTAQVSIEFDPDVLAELGDLGVSLDDWWQDYELDELKAQGEALDDVEFKEFDESVADDVKYHECPHCGKSFPA